METRYFQQVSEEPIQYKELTEKNNADKQDLRDIQSYTWRDYSPYTDKGLECGFAEDFVIVKKASQGQKVHEIPNEKEKFNALTKQFDLEAWAKPKSKHWWPLPSKDWWNNLQLNSVWFNKK